MTSTLIPQRSMGEEGAMMPSESISRVAERHIAIRYPDFDSVKNSPIIYDKGDAWEVEYELSKGVIGGTPVVVIEKGTLKVLRSFHTQ
jgi:hypothetical protein